MAPGLIPINGSMTPAIFADSAWHTEQHEEVQTGAVSKTGVLLIVTVLLITIFEGAARKWVFPNNNAFRYSVYLLKDLLFMIAAYFGYATGRHLRVSWIGWCAALILIPSALATLENGNIVGVWLSFRAYLVIPVCAFLAAPLLRSARNAELVAAAIIACAMFVVPLGVRQYSLPKTHVLNRVIAGEEGAGAISRSGHVRAMGTFVSVGSMGLFAGLTTWAGAFLAYPAKGRAKFLRTIGLVGIAAGLVCAAVAMSRTGLVFWCAILAGSLMLYLRVSQAITLALGAVAVLWVALSAAPSEDIEALAAQDSLATGIMTRLGQEDFLTDRLAYMFENLMLGVFRHPLGDGLGVGQNGAKSFALSAQSSVYESEWGRIALEVGPAGLLAVLFIRFAAMLKCWQSLGQTWEPSQRVIFATALPYFALMSTGKMAFNHVGNSFAWVVMALALGAALAMDDQVETDHSWEFGNSAV